MPTVVDTGKAIVLPSKEKIVFNKIKSRMASEQGFTLIELLVVMVILGILVAIAVPAYLSFTGKAKTAAAQANVRAAIPAAESYYQDNSATSPNPTPYTYDSINRAGLVAEAPGIGQNVLVGAFDGATTNSAYCIQDTEGGTTYHYIGGDVGAVIASNLAAVNALGACSTVAGMPAGFTPS